MIARVAARLQKKKECSDLNGVARFVLKRRCFDKVLVRHQVC